MPTPEPGSGASDAGGDSWDLPAVPVSAASAVVARPPTSTTLAAAKMHVVRELAEWHRGQKLPAAEEDELVKFAHSCDYDLDRAKKCVKAFHASRKAAPELFSGWDTELPNIKAILDVILVAVMPRKTPQNRRVLVNSLRTPDPGRYVFADVCKVLLMVTETLVLTEPTLDGLVVVHDMGDASFAHFMKFGWSLPRKLNNYMQDGLPLKQDMMHLVNCSSFIDKGLNMMRHIGRKEDWEKLCVHSGSDYSVLHQHVPLECLPSDLGGTLPSIVELHEMTVRRLAAFKDVFRRQLAS